MLARNCYIAHAILDKTHHFSPDSSNVITGKLHSELKCFLGSICNTSYAVNLFGVEVIPRSNCIALVFVLSVLFIFVLSCFCTSSVPFWRILFCVLNT